VRKPWIDLQGGVFYELCGHQSRSPNRHNLIVITIEAYEAGKYEIRIPALLVTLEGSIKLPVKGSERIEFLRQQMAAAADSINQVMWVSINALVGQFSRRATLLPV